MYIMIQYDRGKYMKLLFFVFMMLLSIQVYAKDAFIVWKKTIENQIEKEMLKDDLAFKKEFSLTKLNNLKYFVHENIKSLNDCIDKIDQNIERCDSIDKILGQLNELDKELVKLTKMKSTYNFIKLRSALVILSKNPYKQKLDYLTLSANTKEKYQELLQNSSDFKAMKFQNDLFNLPKSLLFENDHLLFSEKHPLIQEVCELSKLQLKPKYTKKIELLCVSIKEIATKHSSQMLDILENYEDAYPSEQDPLKLFKQFLDNHPYPNKKDNLENDVQFIQVPS